MKSITLTYNSTEDLKLELYLPKTKNPPLLIYLHGGGIEAGNRFCLIQHFDKLSDDGYAIASVDYRMYPTAKFPEFIEDSAEAVAFLMQKSGYSFSKIFIGGSSAGGYLSMMLLFDSHYLKAYNIDPLSIDGWLLDAGQPTTHFNVLRERNLDTRLVRVDDAAPFYYIDHDFKAVREDGKLPLLYIISSSNDITCRLEQLRLLYVTLQHFGYPKERLEFIFMDGFSHCGYNDAPIFSEIMAKLLQS